MRYLPDDLGKYDRKIHKYIWPQGQWKGRRLVSVPLEYLRKYIKRTPRKDELKLWNMANTEIQRRGFSDDDIHVTEHVSERFTQRWADLIVRFQRYTGKPKGVITIVKNRFKKALLKGVTSKADGNNGFNYNVRFANYRWLYGLYFTDKSKNSPEYKIISVVPNTKQKNKS